MKKVLYPQGQVSIAIVQVGEFQFFVMRHIVLASQAVWCLWECSGSVVECLTRD